MNDKEIDKKPIVAVTMGDPAGIGPELCLIILRDRLVLDACTPVVFGDIGVLKRVAKTLGWLPPENVISIQEWKGGRRIKLPTVIDCGAISAESVIPGNIHANCGQAVFTYISSAIESALAGRVMAVATAPINKESLRAAGVDYPGHTEIFESLTGADGVCMMLASDEITVSMVTTHMGYVDVPSCLSVDRIVKVIQLTTDALLKINGKAPLLGVCGLNPHAGENGLFGKQEEERFIIPAIEKAQSAGILVEGPLPPDTAFVPEFRKRFDAIVCMYHDQGHIPFKMLAFDKGVNITLGSSVVRTSVDHGTAFDIAWTGKANPTSLIHAILWAIRLLARDE